MDKGQIFLFELGPWTHKVTPCLFSVTSRPR
jgi:hypothetical protein